MATRTDGLTALMVCGYNGHATRMRELLKHSPEIQVRQVSGVGANALLYAVKKGNTDCVEMLLRHRPSEQLAVRDRVGISAVDVACIDGNPEFLELLLRHGPPTQHLDAGLKHAVGAYVEAVADRANVHDSAAARSKRCARYKRCIQLLVVAGADPFQKFSSRGETKAAVSIATETVAAAVEDGYDPRTCARTCARTGASLPCPAR
jgi:ankyrin repeat protein